MILSNISQPLLGLVDTAILGHLGTADYLAAVAVGAGILAFLYWAFGFLRMGTTGLVAQAVGRGDPWTQWLILGRAGALAITLGLLLILASAPLTSIGVWLMGPEPAVAALADSYCRIRLLGAPAALMSYVIVGWYVGRQDTRIPLLLLVTTNGLNVLLDLWFIVGLGLQSDGAALATVIAEYSGLALGLLLLRRAARLEGRGPDWAALRDLAGYGELLRVNRHLFVRTVCLLFAFAFFTAQGARLGADLVAANAILMNLLLLTAYGLDGFAHAVEALVGEAVGAASRESFYAAVASCAQWSLLTAGLFTLGFLCVAPWLPGWFTDVPAVTATVRAHYCWLMLMPLLAVASYLLDGVFIGATRTAPMQHTMLVCVLLVYLPAWYLSRPLGNHGLWLAFALFNAARGISLGLVYWRCSATGCWFIPRPASSRDHAENR